MNDFEMINDLTIAQNCLCSKLRAISRQITRAYDHVLKPLGINANQLNIMVGINLMGPVSITSLSDELIMDRTTLTRNLKPLEKSGYIEMNQGYGRAKQLLLTELGKKILNDARPLWHGAQMTVKKHIGGDKPEAIEQLLDEILKIDFAN